MVILASRAARICKTDGLLARAGELCGTIGASCISPFFPFVLGFALWRYLRLQLQTSDRSVLTRNKRFSLRLLRGAAFSVTLMLPAKGLGSGSFTHRFLYSASTTVWCKRDNGTWGPNYANVLGNFISGGISNTYYPAADRGVEQTLDRALTVTAEGVIGRGIC